MLPNMPQHKLTNKIIPPSLFLAENDGGIQEEERNTTAPVLQASFSTSRPPVGPPRIPHHPPLLHPVKAEVIRREQLKRAQSYKMEEVPGALSTDQQNFSLEAKQDPEYVSARSTVFVSRNILLGNVLLLFLLCSVLCFHPHLLCVLVFFSPFLILSPSFFPLSSVFWCFSPSVCR